MSARWSAVFGPTRAFVHPAFDLLLIGGGLSLLVTGGLLLAGSSRPTFLLSSLPFWILLINLSHFAASTVRLYSKRGTFKELPFVTMGLPLVTLAALGAGIAFADSIGQHLMNLYLTWSPYHYAAQTYGLTVMYCYRSSLELGAADRGFVRAACLSPFLFAFVKGPTAGLEWFVPAEVLSEPAIAYGRSLAVIALGTMAVALPFALVVRHALRGRPLPLISLLTMVANAVWWTGLQYIQSFFWVATFHAIQYLSIVMIFHVKERMARPDNRHGWAYHAGLFYAACVALAYLLFSTWPYAFVAAGFGLAESSMLVIAVVNIHHFLVDAYIWRLRRDPNYRIVSVSPASAAVAAGAAY